MKQMTLNGRSVHFIAGLHGNEKSPVRAMRDQSFEFTLGNPPAYEKNVRFIDFDLNASFKRAGDDYEAKRAAELLELIGENEIVVDFHTTSAVTESFVILTDINMLPYAEFTGLKHAVLMTHNIKSGHALINHRNGISIELSGYDTEDSYNETRSILSRLEQERRSPITLYEVYDRITEPGDYVNFQENADGFYPILVGEEAYNFIGLKARKNPVM